MGLLWYSAGEEFACSSGDPGLIPGSGRSPGARHATCSCVLAWRAPWTEEPGRAHFMGLQRIRQDWVTLFFRNILHVILFCNTLFWCLDERKLSNSVTDCLLSWFRWWSSLGFRTTFALLLDNETLFLAFEMKELEYNFKRFICVTRLLLCNGTEKIFNFASLSKLSCSQC